MKTASPPLSNEVPATSRYPQTTNFVRMCNDKHTADRRRRKLWWKMRCTHLTRRAAPTRKRKRHRAVTCWIPIRCVKYVLWWSIGMFPWCFGLIIGIRWKPMEPIGTFQREGPVICLWAFAKYKLIQANNIYIANTNSPGTISFNRPMVDCYMSS